ELPPAQGLAVLRKVVASHPNPDVRQEALEVMIEKLPPADAIAELQRAAKQDSSSDFREEATEELAKLPDDAGLAAVVDIARTDRSADLRSHAIELLAKHFAAEKAAPVLEQCAFEDSSGDVQETAVDALSNLPPEAGLQPLIRIARTHPNSERRKDAVEH